MKGNVMDLAVGVIIGGAFGKITASLVGDVVMPVVGLFVGGIDFAEMAYELKPATETAEAVMLNYGAFVQSVFDFVILALVIFVMVKGINNMKRKEEEAPAAPAEPPREEVLLEQILDTLKAKG